jgi:DNA primase
MRASRKTRPLNNPAERRQTEHRQRRRMKVIVSTASARPPRDLSVAVPLRWGGLGEGVIEPQPARDAERAQERQVVAGDEERTPVAG